MKIGIIGPKPYLIGHDPDEPPRSIIREQINQILKKISEKYKDEAIIGLTGLGLGVEQDFAHICIDRKIEYIAYLPHDNQESHWGNLPEHIIENYKFLLKNAFDVHMVSDGEYTPKKMLLKKEAIIKDCDALIYIESKFCRMKNQIEEMMMGKKIPLINVKY